MARMLKWTKVLPFSALLCWPALLSVKPQGWNRSLQGAGPSVLAQFALDQDPQGGERMTTSYSPEATRAM